MKEIKLKAWDKELKSMSKGMLLSYWLNHAIDLGDSTFKTITWLLFTGYKDENKKEVYEGDIVKGNDFYGVVKWINFSWQVHRLDADGEVEEYFIINDYKFEVIGNIYQNIDILKKIVLPHP